MRLVTFSRPLRHAIGGVVLAVFLAGLCRSEERLEVHGNAGPFSTAAVEGVWAQRSITVANTTDSPLEAKTAFETLDPKQGRTYFSRVVTVPPHSARRAHIAFRAGVLEEVRSARKESASAKGPAGEPGERPFRRLPLSQLSVVLWDTRSGQELHREFRLVAKVFPRLNVVASAIGLVEEHDANAYMHEMPDQELGEVESQAVAQASMSDRWYGYSIAGILLVGGLEMSTLGPSQLEAVLDWVRRGGVMVLTGGEELPRMLQGELAQAAGVGALGVHRVGRLDVTECPAAAAGAMSLIPGETPAPPSVASVELAWPLPMVELYGDGAETLYEANHLPLLTRKPLGHGWVFTLATPVGALSDPRLHRVWWKVARARSFLPPVNEDDFFSPGRSTLVSIAGRRGPGRAAAALILAVPAFLAVLGGVLLFRRRRGELVWLVLVPLAMLTGLGMYLYGLSQREQERLTHVTLISALGGGSARTQGMFAYYSGEETRKVTFSSDSPRGLIREAAEAGAGAMTTGEVRTDGSTALRDRRVDVNSTRAFYVDTVEQTPGITGEVTFGPSGLTLTLTNHLGADITDAVIYVNRQTYRLGLIAARGQTSLRVGRGDLLGRVRFVEPEREKDSAPADRAKPPRPRTSPADRPGGSRPAVATGAVPPGTGPARPLPESLPERPIKLARGEFTGSLFHTPADALRNNLVGRLAAAPGISQEVGREAVLIGYTSLSPLNPLGARGLDRQGWSVVVWPLEPSRPPPGSKVLIPEGFVNVDYRHLGPPVWDPMNERFNPAYRGVELLVLARPPAGVGDLREARAHLKIQIHATGYRLTVAGVEPLSGIAAGGEPPAPPLARRLPIRHLDSPDGVVNLVIDEADRFKDDRGNYVFSLRVNRLGGEEPLTGQAAENLVKWSFESVDVALEGTCK